MAESDPKIEQARCPGPSYTDMLKADTRPAPDYLLIESNQPLTNEPLSTDAYTSPAFKSAEDEKMWPHIWQFAAREEDMPDAGDTVVYEIGDKSFLLVRQRDLSIRAFYNVCLHRGRKLRTECGPATQLRCPFHGFTWNNDGSLKEIPCNWDFQHLEGKDMSLPELRVERWQGFVLITENHDLPPFREWIGPGVEHYDNWRLEECHTAAWVGKVIPANWKAVAEAFMEAWHSIVTHPQILGFTADAKFTGGAGDARSRRGGIKATQELHGFDADDPWLARKLLAKGNREAFAKQTGHDYSRYTDAEMLDNFTYNIFPNWSPWGGMAPNIVYRWRPWHDTDNCLMEVRILTRTPVGEKAPKSDPMHLIPDGEPFAEASDLIGAALAGVFDQDLANLPHVQTGMKASKTRMLELGEYQESRIRHFHNTLQKYLKGALPVKK